MHIITPKELWRRLGLTATNSSPIRTDPNLTVLEKRVLMHELQLHKTIGTNYQEQFVGIYLKSLQDLIKQNKRTL